MYIKIIGEDTHYNVLFAPFTTQHGYKAVRFSGDEIPSTDKGFKAYDDSDKEICDLSGYTFEYRQNEYSVHEDIIVMPEPNNDPIEPSALDRRLASMSQQISEITPFEQTKKAYYGEIEKIFYGVPQGNVTVFFDNYTGDYSTSRIEDRLTVSFPERLTDMTNINIMVQ